MGWKNSPPAFSTATETIADLANGRLQDPLYCPPDHKLDRLAAAQDTQCETRQRTRNKVAAKWARKVANRRETKRQQQRARIDTAVETPTSRDPSLPTTGPPLQYVDIFVDDFIGLAQDPKARRVRRTLLHAVDHVFRPLSKHDSPFRSEPVSMKKL